MGVSLKDLKDFVSGIKEKADGSTTDVLNSLQDAIVKGIIRGLEESMELWRKYQWSRYAMGFWYSSRLYQGKRDSIGFLSGITAGSWQLYKDEYFEVAKTVNRTGFNFAPDPGSTAGMPYNDLLLKPFLVLDVLYTRNKQTVLRILADNGRIYSLFLGEASIHPKCHFTEVLGASADDDR